MIRITNRLPAALRHWLLLPVIAAGILSILATGGGSSSSAGLPTATRIAVDQFGGV